MIRLYPTLLSINNEKKVRIELTNLNLEALSRRNNFIS
jgi:hypothetical protein